MEKSRKMLTGIVALAGLANAGCLVNDERQDYLFRNTIGSEYSEIQVQNVGYEDNRNRDEVMDDVRKEIAERNAGLTEFEKDLKYANSDCHRYRIAFMGAGTEFDNIEKLISERGLEERYERFKDSEITMKQVKECKINLFNDYLMFASLPSDVKDLRDDGKLTIFLYELSKDKDVDLFKDYK